MLPEVLRSRGALGRMSWARLCPAGTGRRGTVFLRLPDGFVRGVGQPSLYWCIPGTFSVPPYWAACWTVTLVK